MRHILSYTSSVEKTLRDCIMRHKEETGSFEWSADFCDRLLPYATGGKLLRGCLVCFGYEAFSGKPPDKAILDAAAALELAHSALLMHDDVMDNDGWRRGQPALHRQYQAMAVERKWEDPPRFGVNMALCAGDAALFMALKLLSRQTDNPSLGEARQIFANQLLATCFGQMQDIASVSRTDMLSKRDILELMRTKTAAYTVSLPLTLGATLAGQPKTTIDKLRRIGDATGTIFQIRDDELGVMGDTKRTGKPVGADIREGKRTLVYHYLLRRSSPYEQRWLKEIFGNPNCTVREITYVRQLIKRCGILELIDADIARLQQQALAVIEALDTSAATKAELRSLVTFCATRQT